MRHVIFAAVEIMIAMFFAWILLRQVKATMNGEHADRISFAERVGMVCLVCVALVVVFISILAHASAIQHGTPYPWAAWAIRAEVPAVLVAIVAVAAIGVIAAVRQSRGGENRTPV